MCRSLQISNWPIIMLTPTSIEWARGRHVLIVGKANWFGVPSPVGASHLFAPSFPASDWQWMECWASNFGTCQISRRTASPTDWRKCSEMRLSRGEVKVPGWPDVCLTTWHCLSNPSFSNHGGNGAFGSRIIVPEGCACEAVRSMVLRQPKMHLKNCHCTWRT